VNVISAEAHGQFLQLKGRSQDSQTLCIIVACLARGLAMRSIALQKQKLFRVP
jgi:hypothetical protein